MSESSQPAQVGSTDGLGTAKPKISARPIRWRRDPTTKGQWLDDLYGFAVWKDSDFAEDPAFASWDDGVARWILRERRGTEARFCDVAVAKAWCQKQVDKWLSKHAVILPNAEVTG